MKRISDLQLRNAFRVALARRAPGLQPIARVVSPRRWHRQWLPALVVAAVIAITSVPLAWPRLFGRQRHPAVAATPTTPGPDYNVYRGHRWFLKLSGSSAGYIDLETGDKVTLWSTQQQVIGTYTIEATGELIMHWTAVSSGMTFFDQAVVDALGPVGNGARVFVRSTTPTTLVLEVAGHTLTCAQH